MFGFMKKSTVDKEREKEEKEKKKREKKERKERSKRSGPPITQEELARLEEARRGLMGSGGGSNGATPSHSSDSLSSAGVAEGPTYTSHAKVEISKTVKVPPRTQPKPTKPRGILKGKSNYGPEIPNQGVRGNLDDTMTLEENTYVNEIMSGQIVEVQPDTVLRANEAQQEVKRSVKSMIKEFDHSQGDASQAGKGSISQRTVVARTRQQVPRDAGGDAPPQLPQTLPPAEDQMAQRQVQIQVSMEPGEKTYEDVNLQLPNVAPPRCPKPREITLKRQPAGDFGFTLRRGTVLQRELGDNTEKKRTVIFAEPGPKNLNTGLLPGDRLIEVGGSNVEGSSREEIIELIRNSGNHVTLKVQPIPELSELSLRSGLEGEDVEIQDRSVSTGTLQRSGSMRFKNRQAKSEAQLASEKAWLSAERVWLVHKGGFAAGRLQRDGKSEEDGEGKCQVKLDFGGEILEVEEEDVEKANPPQFDRVEDLATLRYLNESSVLHTMRQRYGSNLIHSYAGPSLLIVNPMHPLSIYSEKVIQMFRGCKPEDMPPHIYATAQIAYRNMLASRQDQSIVLLGRSGGGKTTNARHILHYYTVAAGCTNNILNAEKLTALFTLLEAFGNSRTIMNTSATRFVQLTSLDFDQSGQIAGASIQVLMLEKSRVARRPEGEPTFHVFYQMLAGVDTQMRKDLQLENLNEPNIFMTPLQRSEDRQRATAAWAKILHATTVLGISPSELHAVLTVLAAIYHLGVAGVTTKGPQNKSHFAQPAAAARAATLLGCTPEELARNVFSAPQTVSGKGTLTRGGPDRSPTMPPGDLPTGMDCLEGFVIGLYSEAFAALLSLINRCLASNTRTLSSILLLDCPGFQNPATCGRQVGAGFEDLCHNYLQERLQMLFHEKIFTAEQDLYAQENIECDFEPLTSSPGPMVSLMDKASSQALVRSPSNRDGRDHDDRGLLWILDEEAILQGATEETLVQRLIQNLGEKKEKRDTLLKRHSQQSFTLNHFQGTNPVTYNVKGWLRACRENPVARGVNVFLQDSQKEEVRNLYSSIRGSVGGAVSGSIVGMEGTSTLRRTASMRRTFTTGTASLKRRSLCVQVKFQADSVIDSVRRTRTHFIHCFLPQNNAGLCDLKASMAPPIKGVAPGDDIMMNVPTVRSQIRGAEILDAIRIYRQGFPEHIQFAEFRRRFEILAPPDLKLSGPTPDEKQVVEKLLEHLDVDKSTYRLGLSQVFFRSGCLAQLEDAREEKITGFISKLQAYCRGYLGRKNLHKLKLQHLAVTCIQRNVRKLMGIRNWSWWRLYTKVQPLLNVHRTEEELRDREGELEALKIKLEKLEKERNEYKQNADRLESKLSDMTADLADEHTTSNQASELLEQEMADRLRLEKELKEIQSRYNTLQRKHEAVEMDLLHTRMAAASMEQELDEDEMDGADSVYRDRYERTRREMEMVKQQLKREHEEDVEQLETSRKHIERKLADSVEDAEEQRRLVATHKRKAQRLQQDVADTKLHLEEALTRNNELEKKQRKFDSEMHKVQEILKEEKALRDKIQREKEQISVDKFTAEQELKNLKLDGELQQEKVDRLEKELRDLSSIDKNDKESVALKRLKNELERKLQDQEEELDEQAGTIQQLEQAKLRLEMAAEKSRQQHVKELDEKEQEMEEMRASTQKKLRALESQIEEEYEEKQAALREKRELERKIQELGSLKPTRDRDTEKRLRHDLKRTKALLQDAQLMLEKNKEGAANRNTVRQLRNQLEDVEFAAAAAVKARKGVEMEVTELQQQLDDISKAKQDAEERCLALTRENNELQTHLDEREEDEGELMKKYKALVQQQSVDLITFQDQSKQIEELRRENELLKEEVGQLTQRIEYLTQTTVDVELSRRLEAKVREVESRLELETVSRNKAESQLARVKEQLNRVSDEKLALSTEAERQQEVVRRVQRQLRDLQELHGEVERKEAESSQRKQDLERKVQTLEADYEQSQADLKLAFKRIADLQNIIEDDIDGAEEDSDVDSQVSDYMEDSDSEYDDADSSLVNHRDYGLPSDHDSSRSTARRTPLGDVQSLKVQSSFKVIDSVTTSTRPRKLTKIYAEGEFV